MKAPGAVRLRVIPTTLPKANVYIERWHRHHAPLRTVHGGTVRTNKGSVWFCLACVDPEGRVVGVACAGRPIALHSDGQTIEVHRVATDGTPNACSALLGAVARAAAGMGAHRVITFTLETEPGTSLRAAGWNRELDGIPTGWAKSLRNGKGGSGETVWRPHMDTPKVRWGKVLRPDGAVAVVDDSGTDDIAQDDLTLFSAEAA